MKKFASFFFIFVLAFALFKTPAVAQEQDQSHGVISAKGSANIDVVPDVATVTIAIETEAKDLKKAIDENNAVSEKINSNLKNILGKDDKIKTTKFQVNPVYTYNKNAVPRNMLTGYKAINQIYVKTKDINKLGEIIEIALNSGANRISGLNYDIEDSQKICNGLLSEAVQQAKTEAETLAKALGVKITGISKVSSSCNDRQTRPYLMNEYSMDKSMNSVPPLEAGETTVSAEVFVDFVVE